MTTPTAVTAFRELTDDESRTLLANHSVGRLAYTLHDRVDIEPVGYTNDHAWIFGRTSAGTKLSTLLHHPWCAFEVDEVRGQFDWSSVVVKGTFYLLDPEIGSPDTYQRAEELLRDLVPGTFSAQDPAPHRNILFGIFIREITGRTAQSVA
jgi:nitroimidazol reductase NimA-like FMN-containing flavoprotein (pyridoxamine 5'-phosphate oxidase superfamily)